MKPSLPTQHSAGEEDFVVKQAETAIIGTRVALSFGLVAVPAFPPTAVRRTCGRELGSCPERTVRVSGGGRVKSTGASTVPACSVQSKVDDIALGWEYPYLALPDRWPSG